MLKEKTESLLAIFFKENQQLFLIDLKITPDNKITVIIDGDQGVTLNDCIAVSRHIEHNLDREEHDFSLDVTSTGATAPITNNRQYKKNIGRVLKVTTAAQNIEATLQEVLPEGIKLSWAVKEPKPVGKGKVTVNKETTIPFGEILEAKVIIKF